jgi:hypothetical protein
MTYKINKTDGTLLAEVVDSTIDQTATDLTLIGKNVASYGEFINENLVKLLENFANTSEPNNPIVGQLWFDTAQNRLKVYDGLGFKIGSGPLVTGTPPVSLVQGDLWIDSLENQLHFFDGTDLQLAGPIYKDSQGLSGFTVESIYDSAGALRVVVYLWVSQTLLGIFSKNTVEFTPATAIPGFSGTIKPGFNGGTLTGMKFNVTASKADKLVNPLYPTDDTKLLGPDSFLSTSDPLISAGGTLSLTGLSISPSTGTPGKLLVLGNKIEVSVLTSQFKIESNSSTITSFSIRTKNNLGVTKDALWIDTQNEKVGIYNSNPQYNLDVTGNFRATTGFQLPRYTTGDRDARTMTSANNGELIYNTTTNKIQAYAAGAWVDLN